MATRTIEHMYDDHSAAVAALRDLEAAGVTRDRISLLGPDAKPGAASVSDADTAPPRGDAGDDDRSGAGTGALVGTALGGTAGLLAGLGSLAIPGLGPVVAAGWLVAALTGAGVGAAAGGLVGALTDAGVSEERANLYAEGLRRGGTLLLVRAEDTDAGRVDAIMRRHNPTDAEQRAAEYRQGGWSRFAPEDTAPSPTSTLADTRNPASPATVVTPEGDIPSTPDTTRPRGTARR